MTKKNKPIKTFSKKAKDPADKIDFTAGMNQFTWNMLYPAGETIDGLILWNGGVGPIKAAPGKYKARFRLEKDSADIDFTIKSNPGYERTEADYDEQVSFLLQLRDKFTEVQKTIKNIRLLRTGINDFIGRNG